MASVHTGKSRGESYLIIPDTQDPYSPDKWWRWALAVAKDAKVSVQIPGRVLHTGDEADQYHASRFTKDPDAPHGPAQELDEYKARVKQIAACFPHIWHARSNHGDRWRKKAMEAGFPEQLFRLWSEVIGAPKGWRWQTRYIIEGSKERFVLEHGHEGSKDTRTKALDNGLSTVHGHDHSSAQIRWVKNRSGRLLWAMNAACLVDPAAKAFEYGSSARFGQTCGIALVHDGGLTPEWIPFR